MEGKRGINIPWMFWSEGKKTCLSSLVYSLSGVRRAASSGRTDHQLSWRVRGATLFWCHGKTCYHDAWVVKIPRLPQYLGYQEGSWDDQMTILPAIFRTRQDVRLSRGTGF